MPIYEYRCNECEREFEKYVPSAQVGGRVPGLPERAHHAGACPCWAREAPAALSPRAACPGAAAAVAAAAAVTDPPLSRLTSRALFAFRRPLPRRHGAIARLYSASWI